MAVWLLVYVLDLFQTRGIAQSIFKSNWLDGDLKYKKDMLFVMARSAKAFVLSGYFFFASYETYTKVR